MILDELNQLNKYVSVHPRFAAAFEYIMNTKFDGMPVGKKEVDGQNILAIISDEDAVNYIKVFTFLSKDEVEGLILEHNNDKSRRLLQNKIAEIVTVMVHGENDLKNAIKASKVLFGKSSKEDLESLDENTFNEIFEGVPSSTISLEKLSNEIEIENLLASHTNFHESISEARRSLKESSISVNKNKISETYKVSKTDLINNNYVLLQRGRKNYYLVIFN